MLFQSLLDFFDNTKVSIIITFSKVIVRIESEQEAIEWSDFFRIEFAPEPFSKQIVFLIENASLFVDIWNSLLEYVFVRLRDISNQEITKNNEQESDHENPHDPDHQSHESGELNVNRVLAKLLLVDNLHPVRIAWLCCLPDSVPESVNVILNDGIIFLYKLSTREICYPLCFCWLLGISGTVTAPF